MTTEQTPTVAVDANRFVPPLAPIPRRKGTQGQTVAANDAGGAANLTPAKNDVQGARTAKGTKSGSKPKAGDEPGDTDGAGDAPAIVLAGLDANGRAHGSWFTAAEAERAKVAAEASALSAMDIDGPAMLDITSRLPRGKLYASGKAFVPFVSGKLFAELAAQVPDEVRFAPMRRADAPEPLTDEEQKLMDGATPGRDWGKLKAGQLVLAHDEDEGAWYEAVVMKVVTETDTLAMRWRDYPEDGVVFRKRATVGIPPAVLPKVE